MPEQNPNKPVVAETVRPTKKQRDLLLFLETFIAEHGYSPSYREIMNGCGYNSVATVAMHIGNLIKRGHVVKRDRSARSLEVVASQLPVSKPLSTNQVKPSDEKWLVEKVDYYLAQLESQSSPDPAEVADLQVLLAALRILGLEQAAQSFAERATAISSKKQL